MTLTIRSDTFTALPDMRAAVNGEKAHRACESFGGLARWLLVEELRAKSRKEKGAYPLNDPDPPVLPKDVGACSPLGVWDELPDRSAGLAYHRGYALPLQWVPVGPSGRESGLPQSFLAEANRVKALLVTHKEMLGARPGEWQLRLHPEAHTGGRGPVDLSEMGLEPASAWAALAGGLYLAVRNATPEPTVTATGIWDPDRGVRSVAGLEHKLPAARRHGAKKVFVPEEQAPAARAIAGPLGLDVGELRQDTLDPLEVLREYLRELAAPPPGPDLTADPEFQQRAFEQCRNYFLDQERGSERATRYYWEAVRPYITARVKDQLSRSPSRHKCRPTHLVTFLSRSPELILLMAEALRGWGVRNVLVLCSEDVADRAGGIRPDQIEAWTEPGDGMKYRTGWFDSGEPRVGPAIRDRIETFLGPIKDDPSRAILDITPGTGRMRWLADRAMPQKSWRVFLRAEYDDQNRPIPGTEQPVVWPADD
jgi:hypothetical protein